MQPQHPQDSNVDWSLVAMLVTLIGSFAFVLTHVA